MASKQMTSQTAGAYGTPSAIGSVCRSLSILGMTSYELLHLGAKDVASDAYQMQAVQEEAGTPRWGRLS